MLPRTGIDRGEKAEAEAKQIWLKSPNLHEFALDYIRRHQKKTGSS